MNTYTETAPETEEKAPREEFCIDSKSAAEWYLRQLANIEAEKARIQAQAVQMIKDLQIEADGLKYLYQSQLESWARQELERDNWRRKTYRTLQGNISFRNTPASVHVADPVAALAYCQSAAPALVRTSVSVDAAAYQQQAARHWSETGELLPGTESTPAHESVKLTFGKPAVD